MAYLTDRQVINCVKHREDVLNELKKIQKEYDYITLWDAYDKLAYKYGILSLGLHQEPDNRNKTRFRPYVVYQDKGMVECLSESDRSFTKMEEAAKYLINNTLYKIDNAINRLKMN